MSALASIGSASQALVYTQQDLAALTSVVDTKATVSSLVAGLATKSDTLDAASSVTVGSLHATTGSVSGNLTVGGGVDISGTTAANQITASTITATTITTTSGYIDAFGSRCLGDNGSGFYICYNNSYAARIGRSAANVGINRDANQGYTLDVTGSGRFSGALQASNFASTSDQRI